MNVFELTHPWERKAVAAAAVVGLALATALGFLAAPADAAYAQQRAIKQIGDDYFYNYDFLCDGPGCAGAESVDWQMHIIFRDRGTEARAEQAFSGRYPHYQIANASNKHGRINPNGKGFYFKAQRGRTTHVAGCEGTPLQATRYHYRNYPPNEGSFYYPGYWGNFHPASTHRDYNDNPLCPRTSRYSNSELVEDDILRVAPSNFIRDAYPMGPSYNGPDRNDPEHFWETDGRASEVRIP